MPAGQARRQLAPVATAAVVQEWRRRTEAEYRSAVITQHLTLRLLQIAASPDLIRAGLRIVADELTHAELSHRVVLATGQPGGLALDRESLAWPRRPDLSLESEVLRIALETFCLGETIAVRLFQALRAGCTVPVARRTLDRVLRDEVRHRDFGWALLTGLLASPQGEALREQARAELPGMLAVLRTHYAPPDPVGEPIPIGKSERAWGLMPIESYRQQLSRTISRDYRPRLARLNLEVDDL